MTILVTGGAGYIGSHTCITLLEAGEDVLVLDNLSNSSEEALRRISRITGKQPAFIKADIRDSHALAGAFRQYPVDAVMHFAGLKSVNESVTDPLQYYRNNVEGTLVLLDAMAAAGVFDLIFSSSATIYGDKAICPVRETATISPTNPYGQTKAMIEAVLGDLAVARTRVAPWRFALLRYFNPVGAHVSGLVGEDPVGIPNNLLPYITRVATGSLEKLSIFGGDYPTRDGTGVRDYIHVTDLAGGHYHALQWLRKQQGTQPVCEAFNLGTGRGYSVLEVVAAFEKASGRRIPCQVVSRRVGDVAESFADPAKAETVLGWRASRVLADMMTDAWRWQKNNPQGYRN